jgi:membrane protein implicated in regulation of membrane protease activity
MLKKINVFFSYLSDHVSLLVLVVGSSAFAVAWGWAASAAEWLTDYGALAWVVAASLGAAFFILLALGYAKAREKITRTSIERRFFQQPDRVNPLQPEFRHQRIRLADFVSPIEPVIRGKSFTECEIIGPANIVFNSTGPGRGVMLHCELSSTCGILVREGAPAINAIQLVDCNLQRCKLHQVTLLIPEGAYEWAQQQFAGITWLTPEPQPR